MSLSADLLTPLKVAGSSVLGATIMRARGIVNVSQHAAAPGTGDGLTVGLIIGQVQDVGTARPDPVTDPELDWFWNSRVFYQPTNGIAVVDEPFVFNFDVKSKRRMEELQETCLLSIHNNSVGVASVLIWRWSVLLALP